MRQAGKTGRLGAVWGVVLLLTLRVPQLFLQAVQLEQQHFGGSMQEGWQCSPVVAAGLERDCVVQGLRPHRQAVR